MADELNNFTTDNNKRCVIVFDWDDTLFPTSHIVSRNYTLGMRIIYLMFSIDHKILK
ncbi:hypothetical protein YASMINEVIRUS_1443 [Yasminevirus sp. GU-2018]|uniref:Uncharacterized protein n=1 Tax=Yasminevirus sp. GU-2018 TaxID=2420051 RepID=A0A5K0UB48_9VIRU|nr:hypothetical protein YASMINEVIRUS_1443 [Yasminevirus sp. GU-2018]